MARRAVGEASRLAGSVSVERLVESRGVEVTSGRGDCPLCGTAGGLGVDGVANRWSCSSCGESGGPVEWVQATEGVSLAHAVELLRAGGPVTPGSGGEGGGRPPKRATTQKLELLCPPDVDDGDLLGAVAGFYHETLVGSWEPGEFLERRRLGSSEMVEFFGVGFSNRTLGYRLPQGNRKDGAVLRRRLKGLGVLAQSGHEAFRGHLVVPVRDADGQVVQLYGRRLGSTKAGGRAGAQSVHRWLADPARPLFNAAALAVGDEVVVCASVLDALSLWAWGFRHVVAVAGPEAVDDSHVEALAGMERVLVAFRRDDPGEAAAKALAGRLLGVGVGCFRVAWPDGADANDVAISARNPTDDLGRALRSAVWMGQGAPPSPRRPTIEATDITHDPPPSGHTDATADAADPDEPEPEPDEPEPEVESVGGVDPWLVSPSLPAAEGPEPQLAADGDELRVVLGARRWRVRGLSKNTSFDLLRVNVLVAAPTDRGSGFHVDTFDLYSSRARALFVKEAAAEIAVEPDVLKRDLGRVLLAAEGLVEEAIRRATEPDDPTVALGADERAAALELLCDPGLIDRVVADFGRAGVVGEATNLLVGYLAATSRLLSRPLAVVVQSTSAAGKSALLEAVLEFVPPEEAVTFSAMTGQSLYYLGETDLAHKVLAIAEEEGAERAAYALKLLQSEGELSIASTGKDTASGRLVTHEYRVRGPAAILLTTTAIDVDEELLNRCVVLTVDEDQDQTRAIHVRQRHATSLEGLLADRGRDQVVKAHRDAQRLLEPVAVVNPFADRLRFADGATRTRRDHLKYLGLIETIALLHQHQRPKLTATTGEGREVTYIEATVADIVLANRLAHEVLGRSLDVLPPQTRRLLEALDGMVGEITEREDVDRDRVRFTRRQVRERLGWGDTQLKVHLGRLVDLELVWAHRSTERAGAFVYELAWTTGADADGRFLAGLVDPTTLTGATTTALTRSGSQGVRSGGGRGAVGVRSGSGHNGHNGAESNNGGPEGAPVPDPDREDTSGGTDETVTYAQEGVG